MVRMAVLRDGLGQREAAPRFEIERGTLNPMTPFAFAGGAKPDAGRLSTLSGFGAHPGSLRALTGIPANLPAGAPLVIVPHGPDVASDLDGPWPTLSIRGRRGMREAGPARERIALPVGRGGGPGGGGGAARDGAPASPAAALGRSGHGAARRAPGLRRLPPWKRPTRSPSLTASA